MAERLKLPPRKHRQELPSGALRPIRAPARPPPRQREAAPPKQDAGHDKAAKNEKERDKPAKDEKDKDKDKKDESH